MYQILSPFLKLRCQQTNETLLITVVRKNSSDIAFKYLLGANYELEANGFVLDKKSRPRVDINAKDKWGRTALHYAI